jgi:N6-L-threonylcarbamoyladenine synthase
VPAPETLILGIETSCDETSAAVVADGARVRSNVVSSQVELHARYGGVVPEIASRAHLEAIEPIIRRALAEAGCDYADLSAVAVTEGPGLIGSLLVGVTAAKTISLTCAVPLVGVDHIEAHAVSAALAEAGPAPWPAVALVVSGGHTSLYHVRDFLKLELLGQTLDDAAGEAFDKVAAMMQLGFPGGPAIERLARAGDPRAVRFPRARLAGPRPDFSFSGLKTAVLYHLFGPDQKYGSLADRSRAELADVAASFQAAVVEPLVDNTVRAALECGVARVVVGGGVACNQALRESLRAACADAGLGLTLTPPPFCTDSAAMIAALGYHRLRAGLEADLSLEPRAGLLRPRRGAASQASGSRAGRRGAESKSKGDRE